MESLRYAGASVALGVIAVWASEVLFWSAPSADLSLPDMMLTCVAYALAMACVLSAVIVTGCTGLQGAFLGGALMGFLVEGVVVGTMYDAPPLQFVWTPLAWHALISGVAVFALARASVRWSMVGQVAAMVLLGLGGAAWALYWPLERGGMPGFGAVLGYQAGFGALLVLAMMALDRIGPLPRPPRLVLWVAPALAVAVWTISSLGDPRPVRLVLPVAIGLTLWAMHRLGGRGGGFGPPARKVWRHALFLIAPLVTAGGAVAGWQAVGAVAVNVPFVLMTGGIGLGWWVRLLWRAYRAPTAASAAARSIAPS